MQETCQTAGVDGHGRETKADICPMHVAACGSKKLLNSSKTMAVTHQGPYRLCSLGVDRSTMLDWPALNNPDWLGVRYVIFLHMYTVYHFSVVTGPRFNQTPLVTVTGGQRVTNILPA